VIQGLQDSVSLQRHVIAAACHCSGMSLQRHSLQRQGGWCNHGSHLRVHAVSAALPPYMTASSAACGFAGLVWLVVLRRAVELQQARTAELEQCGLGGHCL
jgi:hypothetical protein